MAEEKEVKKENVKKEKYEFLTKWIGWIVALITVCVLFFNSGVGVGKLNIRLDNVETELKSINIKMDKQQELLLEQQKYNVKLSTYIEMLQKQNNKPN